ncbi:MAG TPA: peptidoglycan-associated lipoprotein Pal [Methylophilaceae bacterium]|nr:peptidoglycan-associated lipoprotein Pal [Methylophilaceae bacterium]
MKKSLVMSLVLVAMLAACSSKAPKEAPAKVEDKSMNQTAPAQSADDSASTAGSSTSAMEVNPLKDPSNILSQRSVYFDYDKDDVKAEYRPLIEAHAKYLLAHPSAKVFLQGNTDERGSREYNLSLGQRRAVAVKNVMNLLGVSDKQIETVSYGEEKANTSMHDESTYKQDRRTDIVYEGE